MLAATVLSALLAATPFAGDQVFLEVNGSPRIVIAGKVMPYYATALIYKSIPYASPTGSFLIPTPQRTVFHHDGTVSVWNGELTVFTSEAKGYTELFHRDAELTEIVPMRSDNFLVAEREGKLIEFNLAGRIVAEHPFDGATHVELLADQCTVLYTKGDRRVRRFNVCRDLPLSDFAELATNAGSIRQLPHGDVIVASESSVYQFTRAGAIVRTWPYPGLTHLALTRDGDAFWGAGTVDGAPQLLRFDVTSFEAPAALAFTERDVTGAVTDLVVADEWRNAKRAVKSRVVR